MPSLSPAEIPKGLATRGSHRLADATALTGVALALLTLLAIGALTLSGPIADSLQGPDPCGARPGKNPPAACVQAHRDYYVYDPNTGFVNARVGQIAQTVDSIAWPAAFPLGLAAAVTSGLALAMRTRRRRLARSALLIGALISIGIGFFFLLFVGGGGD